VADQRATEIAMSLTLKVRIAEKAIARRVRRLEGRLRPAFRALVQHDPAATDPATRDAGGPPVSSPEQRPVVR
jgi:hypothetical protein